MGKPVAVESMVLKGKVVTKVAASNSNKFALSQSQPVALFEKQQNRLSPHCFIP